MTEKRFLLNLLEHFYAGSTTLEEEILLKEILEDPALDASFIPDREMFHALQKAQPPVDFLKALETTIDDITTPKTVKKPTVRKLIIRIGAVAASLALILTIAIPRNGATTEAYSEIEELNGMTPQEIGANTMMALSMISRTINSGSRTAAQVSSLLCATATENNSQQ